MTMVYLLSKQSGAEQWVLRRNSILPSLILRMLARILSASGAYWSSIMRIPSSPTDTAILPPAPLSSM